MAVKRGDSVTVIDRNAVAVAAFPSGVNDPSCLSRMNRRTAGSGHVNPGMHTHCVQDRMKSHAESVGDRKIYRSDETAAASAASAAGIPARPIIRRIIGILQKRPDFAARLLHLPQSIFRLIYIPRDLLKLRDSTVVQIAIFVLLRSHAFRQLRQLGDVAVELFFLLEKSCPAAP